MSLDLLLRVSKLFPPGTTNPSQWPRLSGTNFQDHTYDPPRYRISEVLSEKLLSYFETPIYFDYTPSQLEPDGVWEVFMIL